MALFGSAMLSLSTGCPSPNSYGTPRTIPVRRVAHTIAVEVMSARGTSPSGRTIDQTLPSLPTYQLRYGLWDRGDLGIRLGHLSTVGADLKWNFLRTRRFDMAIDPGAQVFVSSDLGVAAVTSYFHAPLLFGINVSHTVSFVPTVGVTIAASSNQSSGADIRSASTASGVLARIGLGVNLRFRDVFALQPEVTYLQDVGVGSHSFVMIGLGMAYGKLPNYDDDDPEIAAERKAAGWSETDDSSP